MLISLHSNSPYFLTHRTFECQHQRLTSTHAHINWNNLNFSYKILPFCCTCSTSLRVGVHGQICIQSIYIIWMLKKEKNITGKRKPFFPGWHIYRGGQYVHSHKCETSFSCNCYFIVIETLPQEFFENITREVVESYVHTENIGIIFR